MKEGWEYKDLDNCCTINYGTRVVKKRDEGSKFPVYGGGGATFKVDTYNREDCFIVSRFAMSVNCTRFVSGKFFLNDSGLSVHTNSIDLSQSFLDKQLLALNNIIYSLGKGAAQRNLDVNLFRKIHISIPPLAEQERIVSILDKAFEKIDAIKANAEENLANAKALFQAALKKELTPKEGWEEKKLGDVALIKIGPFGSLLHKKDYIMGGIPLINPIHMREGKAYPNKSFTVSLEKFSELKQYELKKGDIVLARRGEIGRCALISSSEDCCICGTGSLFVRFHIPMNDNFSILMFQQPFVQNYLVKEATGATMLNINCGIVSNMKVYIPSLKEQNMVVKTLSEKQSLCKEIEQNCQAVIAECDALKQAILRKAFNGEL